MADTNPSLWQYSSPEALQIARQKAIQDAAAEYAKKTQQQRTDEAGYMAGASLRGGLNSLFGVEDQGLQQVKQFQEIMRDVDRQDPNSIFAAAKKLQDIGHPAFDAVVAAGEKAIELAKKKSDAARSQAIAEGYGQNFEAMRMMEIINDPASTPAQIEQAQKRLDALNEKAKGKGGAGNAGTGQLVAGSDGFMYRVDKGTGLYTLVKDEQGRPLSVAQYDATLARNLSQAKAGGTAVGKESGEAQMAIPKLEAQVETTSKHIDELLAHPGFDSSVGATLMPGARLVAGSPQAGFQARFEQLKGEAFSQAYETLRGGGAITEVETRQASAAINRMSTATSEAEFRAAAEDFRQAVKRGLETLRKKSTMSYTLPQQQPAAPMPAPVATQQAPTAPSQAAPVKWSFDTPAKVKAAYQNREIDKATANKILADMESRGIAIK